MADITRAGRVTMQVCEMIAGIEHEAYEEGMRHAQHERYGGEDTKGHVRQAMKLCPACVGLDPLAITRCPMCRKLQEAL